MSPVIVLLKAVSLSFLRAFVGVFAAVQIMPISHANELKALALAAVAAGITAAFRTGQALLTSAEPTDAHVN